MSARLPVYDPDSKRDMAGESRRRREHASAWAACIGRVTRFVSEALGAVHFSMRTLEEQAQGEARPAAEVVEIAVQTARDCGKPEGEAIAPVIVLARRLGYALTPLAASPSSLPDVVGAAADASQAFSEALGAALDLVRSRLVSPVAVDKARKEIHEAVDALCMLGREVEERYAADVAAAKAGATR